MANDLTELPRIKGLSPKMQFWNIGGRGYKTRYLVVLDGWKIAMVEHVRGGRLWCLYDAEAQPIGKPDSYWKVMKRVRTMEWWPIPPRLVERMQAAVWGDDVTLQESAA